MEPPIAITLLEGSQSLAVELAIRPEAIFTTAVGHSSKRTLAIWHVTTPQEIVEHMLDLVKDVSMGVVAAAAAAAAAAVTEEKEKEKANLWVNIWLGLVAFFFLFLVPLSAFPFDRLKGYYD